MNLDTLSNAIAKANAGKQAYVGQYADGTYHGCMGNRVKTRRSAMRLVDPAHFTDLGLTAVPVRG